jgi:hypothetical protein
MLETSVPTQGAVRNGETFSHSGGVAPPKGDGSSSVRTVFFEILGACVGVATLIVAVLALRAMPKQRQRDPESPSATDNGDLPPVGTELEQLSSRGTSNPLPDMLQPAIDTQGQETESSE